MRFLAPFLPLSLHCGWTLIWPPPNFNGRRTVQLPIYNCMSPKQPHYHQHTPHTLPLNKLQAINSTQDLMTRSTLVAALVQSICISWRLTFALMKSHWYPGFCCNRCGETSVSSTLADEYLCFQVGCWTQCNFTCLTIWGWWHLLNEPCTKGSYKTASLPLHFWYSMSQKHAKHSIAELSMTTGKSNSKVPRATVVRQLKHLSYSNCLYFLRDKVDMD